MTVILDEWKNNWDWDWGGPEYILIDVADPAEVNSTRQFLKACCGKGASHTDFEKRRRLREIVLEG